MSEQDRTDRIRTLGAVYRLSFEEATALVERADFKRTDPGAALGRALAVYWEQTLGKIVQAIRRSRGGFARLDHRRQLRSATRVFGEANTAAVIRQFLRYPSFAALDHAKAVARLEKAFAPVQRDRLLKALLLFPPLGHVDLDRVFADAVLHFGADSLARVKKAIVSNPALAGRDLGKVVAAAERVYGPEAGSILLRSPTLANLDHERAVTRMCTARTASRSEIIAAIGTFPGIAGSDPHRVWQQLADVYGAGNAALVRRALLGWPRFATYNHVVAFRRAASLRDDAEVARLKSVILEHPQRIGNRFRRWRELAGE